jgi:hypothetical protein
MQAVKRESGQGDDPNIALTRPQIIGALTLVGQCWWCDS